MKKILLLLLTVSMALSAYTLNWANYELIDPANDLTRSMVYNPATDHLLVATRVDGPRIAVLDAATGAYLGQLDTADTGFEGGTYEINTVAIAEDGAIYAANLHAPAATAGSTFKVYKYDNESASPELIFDDALEDLRYGDSFAAVGSGSETYLYSSGYQNDQMVVLKVGARGAEFVKNITLPSINAARQAIVPLEDGSKFWINGAGDSYPPVRFIDSDGNLLSEVPDSLISPGGSAGVINWSVGNMQFLTAVNVFNSSSLRSCRYFEDELGTVTYDYFGWNSDSLMLAYNGTTLNNNQNGSNAIAYDKKRHAIYVLNGVNSIASVDMNSLLNVATPRDAGLLAVSLDGKNSEYTEFDYLGRSNGRDLFVTWGAEIFTVAMTGNALYAPYEDQRIYIALDTEAEAGSTEFPEDAAGITNLPFAADVVVAVNSDDFADIGSNDPADKWTDGYVYKWSGSAWNENVIDGFDINYGAMALVGDGYDSTISEIGISFDANGMGEVNGPVKFAVILAETDASGSILATFPNSNALTAWYEADSLGSGMYPAYDIRTAGTISSISNNVNASSFQLSQNFPNPFNPLTTISYDLSRMADVKFTVFNILGQEKMHMDLGLKNAGTHHININAADWESGIYFYRLTSADAHSEMKKMVLIK